MTSKALGGKHRVTQRRSPKGHAVSPVSKDSAEPTVNRYLDYLERLERAGIEIKPKYTLVNLNEISPKQFIFRNKTESYRSK